MFRKYLYLFFCLVLLTSCDLFTMGNKEILTGEETEPAYNANVVWELETKSVKPFYESVLLDNYLYAIESTYRYQELPDEFNIIKIDVEYGEKVWSSPVIYDEEQSSVIKNGDKLFVQGTGDMLYCYSDADGALLATINLGLGNASWLGQILSHDTYLYWGTKNRSAGNGLLRFNINDIDFEKEATQEQMVHAELFWNAQESIYSLPSENDGLIYALTYNWEYNKGGKSILVAIDATTKVEKWRKEFISSSEYPFSYPIGGQTRKPLHVVDEYLYVIDYGLGCFNKLSGETIWEIEQNGEDVYHEAYLTASILSDGFEYWDNKFYYAGASSSSASSYLGIPEKYNKNILCINAEDGSLEWGAMPINSATLGGKFVVNEGKLFVLANGKLYVYNAKKGKLLGVKVVTMLDNINTLIAYNDMVIYFAPDIANRKSVLTAIRAK